MPGALDGIRVLDLGINVLAPQAASMLSDLGADVIKVEMPGFGDQGRWIPVSREDRRPPYFVACNRGKRSLTLDLRTPEGRDVILRLVETADVMMSNFRVGTMDEWGLGYDVVSQRNPRLVYATGSVFGTDGPHADQEGADLSGQAAGGLVSTIGSDGDLPGPVGATIADHIAGQNLCSGVLAALLSRERTGRGQQVDVSLLGGQIYAQAGELTHYFLSGEIPGRANRGHPLLAAAYGVFATADGHIAIVGVRGPQRKGFYEAIERPDLAEDPRFKPAIYTPETREVLFELLSDVFATRPTAEWAERLRAHGQRFAVVNDYRGVEADPHAWENGYLRKMEHPEWGETTIVGAPVRMSGTPVEFDPSVPELGQDSEAILLENGFSWDEIGALREAGAI